MGDLMSTPHPIQLRCAGHEDGRLVFDWRNDVATRAASLQTDPIPWPVHELWWKASLGRADRTLIIGEDAWGRPVGLVRFDAADGRWLVSIQIAPDRRGQGWGRALLEGALVRMSEKRAAYRFMAQIKPENEASRRLFATCGFAACVGIEWTLNRARPQADPVEAAA